MNAPCEGFVLSGKENSCESPVAFTPRRCADLNCVSCLVGERACCADLCRDEEHQLRSEKCRGSSRRFDRVDQQGVHKPHRDFEDDGKTFDTGEIKPNESSSAVKFDKEGEFNYHCKIHGKTMSGTIVVKLPAAN